MAYSIQVWGVVYLVQGIPEPPADRRNAPHFFIVSIIPFQGQDWITTVMNTNKCATYETPQLEVIEMKISYKIMEDSPGNGGNEGVIPGEDD